MRYEQTQLYISHTIMRTAKDNYVPDQNKRKKQKELISFNCIFDNR